MKSFLMCLLAICYCYNIHAQNSHLLLASTASSNYNLSHSGVWANISNPASIHNIQKVSIAACFQNHFLLKDFSTQLIAFFVPVNKIVGSNTSLYRFGNQLFSKNELSSSVSLKFNHKLYLGAQLTLQYIHQSEERNHYIAFPQLGATYQINDKLIIASSLRNFLNLNTEIQILRCGMTYRFDKKTQSHIYFEFSDKKYPQIAAALDYRFNSKIYFGFNISNNSTPFHFGIGYLIKNLVFKIDFAYHQQLGFSPISSITYEK